jgi:hypothetical protein
VCSAVFLDIAQAFDRVWHGGLLHKLRSTLLDHFYLLLKSYLTNRHFCESSIRKLQSAINKIAIWTRKWRLKLNESKSVHIDFTNRKIRQQPIFIKDTKLPYANTAKYFGMTLDANLQWKKHIKKKRDELNIKFRKMYWLLGRISELSIHNKIILYKQVIRPVWSFGIQLWGCASDPNIQAIQRYQNKVLKCIVNSPWYIRNSDLHRDLGIEAVTDIIAKFATLMKRDFKTTSTSKCPDFST